MFKTKGSITTHRRAHTGEKTYEYEDSNEIKIEPVDDFYDESVTVKIEQDPTEYD